MTEPFTPRYIRDGKSLGQWLYEDLDITDAAGTRELLWDELPPAHQQHWDDIATRLVERWGGLLVAVLPDQPPKRRQP